MKEIKVLEALKEMLGERRLYYGVNSTDKKTGIAHSFWNKNRLEFIAIINQFIKDLESGKIKVDDL